MIALRVKDLLGTESGILNLINLHFFGPERCRRRQGVIESLAERNVIAKPAVVICLAQPVSQINLIAEAVWQIEKVRLGKPQAGIGGNRPRLKTGHELLARAR